MSFSSCDHIIDGEIHANDDGDHSKGQLTTSDGHTRVGHDVMEVGAGEETNYDVVL